jgi:predicted  nucleic acid-binding Zn-ribbon protein
MIFMISSNTDFLKLLKEAKEDNENKTYENEIDKSSKKEPKDEMRDLKKELKEVKEDNKKLSLQISEMINKLRDAQF